MSRPRALLVFGSGPGIGNHVAAHFARNSLTHIILLARNTERLRTTDAPFVTAAAPSAKVSTLKIDLADLPSIRGVLTQIEELTKDEDIEVVFFNAARVKLSGVLDVAVEEIEEDLKTTTLSLYLIAQWALPRLTALAQSPSRDKSLPPPSLLVTNSHLPWDPVPEFLSLSLVKAAQRNMVQNFNRAFADKGIHAGLIAVEGVVESEKKNLNPVNIAQRTWEFYVDGKGLEVNIKE